MNALFISYPSPLKDRILRLKNPTVCSALVYSSSPLGHSPLKGGKGEEKGIYSTMISMESPFLKGVTAVIWCFPLSNCQ